MHTSAYIQWTGHINMTALGLTATDTGGELGAPASPLEEPQQQLTSDIAQTRTAPIWLVTLSVVRLTFVCDCHHDGADV